MIANHRRGVATVLIVAAAGLGVLGCSDEDKSSGSNHPAAVAVREIQEAFETGDVAAVCERMAREAKEQAARIAPADAGTCAQGVRRTARIVAKDGGDSDADVVVTHVDPRGSLEGSVRRATATVSDDDGWQANVELAKQDGGWKLAGYFGIPPREFEELEKDLQGFSLPRRRSATVEVVDGSGAACPEVHDERYPDISGGCVLEVSGKDVPVRVLTPFGGLELARCSVRYRVSVGPDGGSWTHHVRFEDLFAPECSEITPCLTEEWEYRPWNGRIEADGDGGYALHTYICLRTGAGLFGGELVMGLARDGERWKVEPADQGATGFKIDKGLAVTGEPFDIHGD